MGHSSNPSSTALIHSSTPPSLEIPSTSSEILLASSNPSSNFLHSNFLRKHSPGNHSNSNHSSINSNSDLLPSNSSIFKISGITPHSSKTFRLQDSQRAPSPLSSSFQLFPGNKDSRVNLSSSKFNLLNKHNLTASTLGFPPQVSGHSLIMCPQFLL